jgi:hypothetical protein
MFDRETQNCRGGTQSVLVVADLVRQTSTSPESPRIPAGYNFNRRGSDLFGILKQKKEPASEPTEAGFYPYKIAILFRETFFTSRRRWWWRGWGLFTPTGRNAECSGGQSH